MRRRRIVNHDPLIQYAQAAREQLLVTAIRLRVQVENLRGVIKESERRLRRVVERLETVNTQANETGTIVCPQCRHIAVEPIPLNACLYFYECRNCRVLLKARPTDCCVFCSYGTQPCPHRGSK